MKAIAATTTANLVKEIERLREENEHLKAANSNGRFIQLCMKEAAEKAAAEHAALKEENEQNKKTIAELEKTIAQMAIAHNIAANKHINFTFPCGEAAPARLDNIINFDDENYEYFWAAADGDVVFWKVPADISDLPHPEYPEEGRVMYAFQDGLFGDEWGRLERFGVRTMTKQDLIDVDGNIDDSNDEMTQASFEEWNRENPPTDSD